MLEYSKDSAGLQKKRIVKVAAGLLSLFGALLVYLFYIQIWQAPELNNDSHNRRSYFVADYTQRGSITDRNGVKLAQSVREENGKYRREYGYGAIFANVTGYFSKKYGKSGVEAQYDRILSGADNPLQKFGPLARLWANSGSDAVLTVDATMQEDAYNELGGFRGAAVAMNPKTGEILAFVSKPSFNPNYLERDWSDLIKNSGSPLLDRAAQGLYPPGSTYKALMALEALHNGVIDEQQLLECKGVFKIGNYDLIDDNNEVHGKINLKEAMIDSCNIFFGQLALECGRSKMLGFFNDFHLEQPVPGIPGTVPAVLPELKKLGDGDLAQTGIGQGQLLVTPLQMAMVTAAIANDGVVMLPHLLSEVRQNGMTMKTVYPSVWFRVADRESAAKTRDMMEAVVKRGTGVSARISGVRVGGKTGTAQNPHGKSHSWFIGFAPVENPEICVAVIAENAGYGAGVAASVARRIFADALGR